MKRTEPSNWTPLQAAGRLIVPAFLILLLLAGCAPAATPEPAPEATVTMAPATQVPPLPTLTATAEVQPDPAYFAEEPVVLVPTPEAGAPIVTARYNTVVRSGPGTNYPVYGAFPGGASAQGAGVSENKNWWAIKIPLSPNGTGWVPAQYVTVTGGGSLPVLPTPPAPPTVEFTPPAQSDPQATTLAEVYVRTGPGTEYPAYGVAKKGQTAKILGKSQDGQYWIVRVNPEKVGAGYAWLAAAYTSSQNAESVPVVIAPPAQPAAQLHAPPAGAAVSTALDYVNLRSGPGENYPILATGAPGAKGEVTGKSGDGKWWQVKVPTTISANGFGWVSADWVLVENAANVPVVEAPAPPLTSVTPVPPAAAQCALISQSPADYSVLKPDTDFDMVWTLRNTSSMTWDKSQVDVRYRGALNGVRIHQGPDVYDLNETVKPGQEYRVVLDAFSPSKPGQYAEGWELVQGSKSLCTFYLVIEVK